MSSSRRYDVNVARLIELILHMTPEERGLLLKEAENIKTSFRATRRNCFVSILLYYDEKVHPATITDLSFTGAFVECYIPVMIGDPVTVEFINTNGFGDLKVDAHIVHATKMGFGIRFKTIRSNLARFLQKSLDDYRESPYRKSLEPKSET